MYTSLTWPDPYTGGEGASRVRVWPRETTCIQKTSVLNFHVIIIMLQFTLATVC